MATKREKPLDDPALRELEESFAQEGEAEQQRYVEEKNFMQEAADQQQRNEEGSFTLFPKLPPEMRQQIVSFVFFCLFPPRLFSYRNSRLHQSSLIYAVEVHL